MADKRRPAPQSCLPWLLIVPAFEGPIRGVRPQIAAIAQKSLIEWQKTIIPITMTLIAKTELTHILIIVMIFGTLG